MKFLKRCFFFWSCHPQGLIDSSNESSLLESETNVRMISLFDNEEVAWWCSVNRCWFVSRRAKSFQLMDVSIDFSFTLIISSVSSDILTCYNLLSVKVYYFVWLRHEICFFGQPKQFYLFSRFSTWDFAFLLLIGRFRDCPGCWFIYPRARPSPPLGHSRWKLSNGFWRGDPKILDD